MTVFPLLVAALVSSSGDDVVARVDQVTISQSAVTRRLALCRDLRLDYTPVEAVDSLISDALLAAEAHRLGLDKAPEARTYVDAEMRKLATNAVVDSFAAKRTPDEGALREMFHATADFIAYDLLAYASDVDARAARQRIDKGGSLADEAPHAIAARLYPKPEDAPTSMRGQLQLPPPTVTALFAARVGDVVGPLQNETGWFVARILRKEIGGDTEFAARRPSLVQTYDQQTRKFARSHLVQQLKASAKVQLDEAFLRKLAGDAPTKEQLGHVLATVRGVPVTYADVYPKIAAIGGQGGHMASSEVKVQVAWSVIEDRLVEAFAVERGFDKAADVVAQRGEIERNAFGQVMVRRVNAGVKPPSDREIDDHYAKNAARYGKPLRFVRPQVASEILARKRGDALDALLSALRAKASLSIDPAALARVAS